MGFFSFLGRVLFASLFILSAWQMLVMLASVEIDVLYAMCKLNYAGQTMFNEFGDNGGPAVTELIPKLAIFKKHLSSLLGVEILDIDPRHLVAGMIALKGLGGFLFVFSSPFGAYLLLIYLVFSSPILYDFYNYDRNESTHVILLNEFLQSVALFGALLFFIGMKNLIPRRQLKKKTPKAKVG
ncbi:hypothetical protein POTOM_032025 [Populus tomentosa]|uniref:Nicotiana lesion-inducing like n=1 Tax=Populus tomentosa TaxID=118781 RepID=A0A8X7Z8N3_POPTO|nr:hypothetical protein POTOM_032025 [Populus tomentosa]